MREPMMSHKSSRKWGTFVAWLRKHAWLQSGADTRTWPRGVTVSTLDSESSDRGSNPREAFTQASAITREAKYFSQCMKHTAQRRVTEKCDAYVLRKLLLRWGYLYPCSLWSWVAECIGARQVLWIMWMAHPNQASRPQGYHHVNGGTLAANDSGIGSGWQQSKQN